jgi:hypothetical protein
MEALKIAAMIFAGFIVLCIVFVGVAFKVVKHDIYHNDIWKDEARNEVYVSYVRTHMFAYICSWAVNFGVLWLIIAIILKIIK